MSYKMKVDAKKYGNELYNLNEIKKDSFDEDIFNKIENIEIKFELNSENGITENAKREAFLKMTFELLNCIDFLDDKKGVSADKNELENMFLKFYDSLKDEISITETGEGEED